MCNLLDMQLHLYKLKLCKILQNLSNFTYIKQNIISYTIHFTVVLYFMNDWQMMNLIIFSSWKKSISNWLKNVIDESQFATFIVLYNIYNTRNTAIVLNLSKTFLYLLCAVSISTISIFITYLSSFLYNLDKTEIDFLLSKYYISSQFLNFNQRILMLNVSEH